MTRSTGAHAGDAHRTNASVPWRSGALYVILGSSLVGVMGVSLISPVLPDLRAVFGITDAQVGLIITAYTLPGIVMTPFVGIVADRLGRKRVLVPLLFVFAIGGAGIAFVDTFAAVLALRFVQGVGASALVTLAITLVGDRYEGGRRDAIIGLNGSTIGVGAAAYPVIGGALAGIRWSAPFLFFGIAVLIGILALVVLEEPDVERSSNVRTYLSRLGAVLALPTALAIFVAIFAAFFVFYGAVLTALPLLLADEFGLSAGEIGLLLSMVAVASALVASQYGRISRRFDAQTLVALGFVAYGASVLGLWLSPSPTTVGLSLLSFGVGFGIVMPSIDTTIFTLTSDRLRAGMMGTRTGVLRLGQTLGPVGFTFVAEAAFPTATAGYRTLLLASGSVLLVAGVCAFVLVRRGKGTGTG